MPLFPHAHATHPHWSMAAAGGISLLLLTGLFHRLRGFSLLARSAAGGGVIIADFLAALERQLVARQLLPAVQDRLPEEKSVLQELIIHQACSSALCIPVSR